MKLHANARTCPKSRRLLVRAHRRRGLVAGGGGRGRRRQRADRAPSGCAAGEPKARPGLIDRSSAPRRAPDAAAGRPGRGDRGAAAPADDRGRDRRVPRDGALDRLALAEADRARQALAPRAARAARTATSESAPASWSTSTSRSSGGSSGRRPPRHRHRASQSRSRRRNALGITGWEFVHVCVDDATRLAYVEVLADEQGQTAAGFLRRAVAVVSRRWGSPSSG